VTKFIRASREQLMAAGWDSTHVLANDAQEGPYAIVKDFDGVCQCCNSRAPQWTVLNIATAVGISETWGGANGESEADETASMLNAAWLEGYAAGIK
jgi:hypothetical protein